MRLLELEKLECGVAFFEGYSSDCSGFDYVVREMQFGESRSIYRGYMGICCCSLILISVIAVMFHTHFRALL